MREFLRGFALPKTILGALLIAGGVLLKNETLVNAGITMISVGVGSKAIKKVQGKDPWEHEKQFSVLTELFKKGKYDE